MAVTRLLPFTLGKFQSQIIETYKRPVKGLGFSFKDGEEHTHTLQDNLVIQL